MPVHGICEKCGNETQDYGCPSCDAGEIFFLRSEIERLKRGDFTPEELQTLCHNLSERDACAFRAGCEEYQRKLFGKGSIEEEREACASLVEGLEDALIKDWPSNICIYIAEQIRARPPRVSQDAPRGSQ